MLTPVGKKQKQPSITFFLLVWEEIGETYEGQVLRQIKSRPQVYPTQSDRDNRIWLFAQLLDPNTSNRCRTVLDVTS